MEETKFKCDVCNKEVDELWSFSVYGNNTFKAEDKKSYCKKHFTIANTEHDVNNSKTPQ